ncbi:glycosyltransferase [Metabacillus arenae]|uniref:Glycosyltransferase n=1 Tax=Metabacillus arenae TaxID=2771434 RepID=A0A926NL19_9BACI|nr:glycosyltransferase [Metabacillus arenae]MBD1383005.1 glycosyltransferase [Metabacillus arenae]
MISKEIKQQKLVLLTNRFPFLPGEQFLETEIKYLAEQFNEVHIIPVNASSKINGRKVPSNVIIYDDFSINSNKYSKFVHYTLRVFSSKQGRLWFGKDFSRARGIHPKCQFILLSWLGTALHLKDFIKAKFGEELEDHIFYSYWLSTSALALALLKEEFPGVKAVSRAHRGDLYAYAHVPEYLPLQKEIIERLNKVFVISEDGKNYLLNEHGGSIVEKIRIERLGSLKAPSFSKRSADNVLRIASCSFLSPVKRVHLILDALKSISDIPIEWRHIGDGELRREIEGQINELPNNIQVKLLGNMDNKDVIKNYIDQPVDLFINVSKSEGVPVSIMEAFSCAIPVLATDVGGTSELVDEHNGILVPPDVTAEELSLTIKDFYHSSGEQKNQKSENAFKKWSEEYNAEKNYLLFTVSLKKGD